jgi:hypothetical protein
MTKMKKQLVDLFIFSHFSKNISKIPTIITQLLLLKKSLGLGRDNATHPEQRCQANCQVIFF